MISPGDNEDIMSCLALCYLLITIGWLPLQIMWVREPSYWILFISIKYFPFPCDKVNSQRVGERRFQMYSIEMTSALYLLLYWLFLTITVKACIMLAPIKAIIFPVQVPSSHICSQDAEKKEKY